MPISSPPPVQGVELLHSRGADRCAAHDSQDRIEKLLNVDNS